MSVKPFQNFKSTLKIWGLWDYAMQATHTHESSLVIEHSFCLLQHLNCAFTLIHLSSNTSRTPQNHPTASFHLFFLRTGWKHYKFRGVKCHITEGMILSANNYFVFIGKQKIHNTQRPVLEQHPACFWPLTFCNYLKEYGGFSFPWVMGLFPDDPSWSGMRVRQRGNRRKELGHWIFLGECKATECKLQQQ